MTHHLRITLGRLTAPSLCLAILSGCGGETPSPAPLAPVAHRAENESTEDGAPLELFALAGDEDAHLADWGEVDTLDETDVVAVAPSLPPRSDGASVVEASDEAASEPVIAPDLQPSWPDSKWDADPEAADASDPQGEHRPIESPAVDDDEEPFSHPILLAPSDGARHTLRSPQRERVYLREDVLRLPRVDDEPSPLPADRDAQPSEVPPVQAIESTNSPPLTGPLVSSTAEAPRAEATVDAAPAEPNRAVAPPRPLPPVVMSQQGMVDASLAPNAPPQTLPVRSPEMDRVARVAIEKTRGGFLLARRGALFAARSDFIGALRLLAQAQDAQHQSKRHSQALADGLRALEESDDLVPRGSQLEANLNLAAIVRSHRTPVLVGVDVEEMPSVEALQRYYTYAQERLAEATGGEPAGSMALHGLGKVYAIMARENQTGFVMADSKAMVFHQAALLVDSRNYLAANDLGVLLCRIGRYDEARDSLLQSLAVWPQPRTWGNLAVVHRNLGEHDLAQQAQRRSLAMLQQAQGTSDAAAVAGSKYNVRWVDPSELAGKPKGTGRQSREANRRGAPTVPTHRPRR